MTSEIIGLTKGIDAHPSQTNHNSNWVNFRGAWVTNFLLLVLLRVTFSVVPGLTSDWAWTLSNVVYLIVIDWLFCFQVEPGSDFDLFCIRAILSCSIG